VALPELLMRELLIKFGVDVHEYQNGYYSVLAVLKMLFNFAPGKQKRLQQPVPVKPKHCKDKQKI
jgi:hypothetical protein